MCAQEIFFCVQFKFFIICSLFDDCLAASLDMKTRRVFRARHLLVGMGGGGIFLLKIFAGNSRT